MNLEEINCLNHIRALSIDASKDKIHFDGLVEKKRHIDENKSTCSGSYCSVRPEINESRNRCYLEDQNKCRCRKKYTVFLPPHFAL